MSENEVPASDSASCSMHDRLRRLADSNEFEYLTLLTILLNAAVLGLDTYEDFHDAYDLHFGLVLWASQIFFTVEIGIRILACGPGYASFFRDRWNLFDFSVVAVSFMPAVGSFTTIGRVARVLRVARILSVSDEIRVRFGAGGSLLRLALQSVVSVLVLVFIFAVAGVNLFGEIDSSAWGDLDSAARSLLVRPHSLLASDTPATDRGLAAAFLVAYGGVLIGLLARIARALGRLRRTPA